MKYPEVFVQPDSWLRQTKARLIMKRAAQSVLASLDTRSDVVRFRQIAQQQSGPLVWALIKKIGRFLRRLGIWGLGFHAWLLGYVVCISLLFTHLNPGVSAYMVYRRVFNNHEVKAVEFVPLRDMPASAPRYFMHLEDHNFRTHPGIHLGALREAMAANQQRGQLVFGGSTISMQLARNLLLIPDRVLWRKYLELVAVIPMDFILGKDRVIELYLNYIEFGKGVFGVGTAARHYYKRGATTMTRDQWKRLATIITSPIRFDVFTFWNSRGMVARYNALNRAF